MGPIVLSKNSEDYLEAIYLLKKRNGEARVKDIAKDLNIKLPSVTEFIKKLSKQNLLTYERYGKVKLTASGEKIAKNVYKKHETLFYFLTEILHVDSKIALRDACLMEHGLSKKTLNKLSKFIKKYKNKRR
jgi:DtxR family Mn-dependent transcriptional regulator